MNLPVHKQNAIVTIRQIIAPDENKRGGGQRETTIATTVYRLSGAGVIKHARQIIPVAELEDGTYRCATLSVWDNALPGVGVLRLVKHQPEKEAA